MLVNGRAIAEGILARVKTEIALMSVTPHLTIFTCAPDLATRQFLALKKRRADAVGAAHTVVEFPHDATTETIRKAVIDARITTNGIIVQLPFPHHVDIKAVLAELPPSYDVDVLTYDGTQTHVLPPVVGAIAAIVDSHDILLAAANVVVVGAGRLVGAPAALWATRQGAQVTVVTPQTERADELLRQADVLILGAGKPGLVTPDHVKDGAIVFDAGTSEQGGVLKGDAVPAVAEKAALFTPVPGGIGPITIAVLLRNLVELAKRQ